jgi:formylglycine-generating enzyme required for sulfatase activity
VALVALGFLLGRASAPGSAEVGPKETAQANVVKLPEPSSATPPPPMSGPPASRAEISKATFPKIAIAGQAVAVDLGGGVKLDLVRIPAGSFSMGSDNGNNAEKPVHTVTFAKPFYMGKTEVTQEQWQAVVGINLSRFEGPKNPVEQVSWYDCQEFIRKLSGRTGMRFSLPSEAEWEYACRAGSAVDFCYGDNEAGLSDYAWYISNAGGQTHPVGQTRGNAWGLFDMHGNVWEWCQDVWHSDYQGAPSDGTAWIQGGDQGVRVRRGGSWLNDPRGCRSSDRIGGSPRNIWDGHGVRVVLREF